jgi:hypothetical protein
MLTLRPDVDGYGCIDVICRGGGSSVVVVVIIIVAVIVKV